MKAHRTLRKREPLAAGEAWADSGRMFTDELGERLHPDHVSRHFREMAKAAGLPVIKFHAARHTAATLAQVSGVASDASFGGLREHRGPGLRGQRGVAGSGGRAGRHAA